MIRRRDFITLLGGAGAVWPLAPRAQQARQWRVAYLTVSATTNHPYYEAFKEGMRALGYVEGQNLVLDARGAQGNIERLPDLMNQIIALNPDVVAVVTTPAAIAARRATSKVPIVMLAVTDPVDSGLVNSLARPSGNIIGISHMSLDITAKGLEILRTIMPGVTRIAVLMSLNPVHAAQFREAEIASKTIGAVVVPVIAEHPMNLIKPSWQLNGKSVRQLSCWPTVYISPSWRTPTERDCRPFIRSPNLSERGD
jgi:putative ABC transport system substrate-binding protein